MAKIYEQIDVTVPANAEAQSVIFTSTSEVPRTLLRVWSVHKTATNDLIISDEREDIADVPCDMLPTDNPFIEFNRKIKPGHQLKVGFREGAGAGHTAVICVVSEIPD